MNTHTRIKISRNTRTNNTSRDADVVTGREAARGKEEDKEDEDGEVVMLLLQCLPKHGSRKRN